MVSQDGSAAMIEPALARTSLDRAADERAVPGLLESLRADPATRVILTRGDRLPVRGDAAPAFVTPEECGDGARWGFLGRSRDGGALLVAAIDPAEEVEVAGTEWAPLRAVGAALSADEAAIGVEAVTIGRWLWDFGYCPVCGAEAPIRNAGWSRTCSGCGREHFPRTDPAVIVAVADPTGERLLLGKNAMWASRNMYSTFAGFVEAGESLESTAVREILEEANVSIGDLRYLGSQAWPYPRSLMLGFHAVARDPESARADGEEIVDVRWFTRDEIRAALSGDGDIGLPGAASIANRLIVSWLGSDR